MNLLELLQRATPSAQPLLTGEWATITFRPDLGSQQEFIVGVAAAIEGDAEPHLKWLPSLAKLSHLYGDAITSADTKDLFDGSEIAIRSGFKSVLKSLDSGTPHLRIVPCGYIATHDIDVELVTLLKRHAGAIWQDVQHRESQMDDDWAYAVMMSTLNASQGKANPFVPGRSIVIGDKKLRIGLDNGNSFGNVISARYASFTTVNSHIHASLLQVNIGHKMMQRNTEPALFVVLPEPTTPAESLKARKTAELLSEVEDAGIMQFCDSDPAKVALKIEEWTLQV